MADDEVLKGLQPGLILPFSGGLSLAPEPETRTAMNPTGGRDFLNGYYTPIHFRGQLLDTTQWHRDDLDPPPEYYPGKIFVPAVDHPVYEFRGINEDAIADLKFLKDRCELSFERMHTMFVVDFAVPVSYTHLTLPTIYSV